MGQGQEEIVDGPEMISNLSGLQEQCAPLSNDDIAYRTKQYLTLSKMIDILLDIEDAALSIVDPTDYLIDIRTVLYDLYFTAPTRLTLEIFNPERRPTGIHNGVVLTEPHTILHSFNEFILTEYEILKPQERMERAKQMREEASVISKSLMEAISGYCASIGNAVAIQTDQGIQPLQTLEQVPME